MNVNPIPVFPPVVSTSTVFHQFNLTMSTTRKKKKKHKNLIYIQTLFTFHDFFVFPNTHLWVIQKFLYVHSLLTHTRISFHTLFTHAKNPSIHIFLLHSYMKNIFFFFSFYTQKSFYTHFPSIHNASFFLS